MVGYADRLEVSQLCGLPVLLSRPSPRSRVITHPATSATTKRARKSSNGQSAALAAKAARKATQAPTPTTLPPRPESSARGTPAARRPDGGPSRRTRSPPPRQTKAQLARRRRRPEMKQASRSVGSHSDGVENGTEDEHHRWRAQPRRNGSHRRRLLLIIGVEDLVDRQVEEPRDPECSAVTEYRPFSIEMTVAWTRPGPTSSPATGPLGALSRIRSHNVKAP